MNLLHDFERRVDQLVRNLFGEKKGPAQGREIIEIQRTILDAVDARVQLLPRARRAFPYNEIAVSIPAPDAERRTALEMVFVTGGALQSEIIEHLRRRGIEFPQDLFVTVTLVETGDVVDPVVVCRSRKDEAVSSPVAAAPVLRRVRFTPPGAQPIEVEKERIQVGRTAEVLDDRRRLVRRNDVVIDEGTVSRAHAHIEFVAGEYRLFDDGSSYGTSVIHQGRLLEVPKAGGRGMKLSSGDEIYFGQVRVAFAIVS